MSAPYIYDISHLRVKFPAPYCRVHESSARRSLCDTYVQNIEVTESAQ